MTKTLKYIFLAGTLLFIVLGFFINTGKAHFTWEAFPLFDVLFGFFGCLFIVVVAKLLGHFLVQKDENYYD